jgi:hypothetical protein
MIKGAARNHLSVQQRGHSPANHTAATWAEIVFDWIATFRNALKGPRLSAKFQKRVVFDNDRDAVGAARTLSARTAVAKLGIKIPFDGET